MAKNKPGNFSALVYSTDPNFKPRDEQPVEKETIALKEQPLKIKLETKHRAGKTVTLITGFTGRETDLEDLGKKLKTSCGTGGSARDGEIIVQGDHRDKVLQWLQKNGYTKAKKI